MIKLEILRLFPHINSRGLVDKIWDNDELGHTIEFCDQLFFIFKLENILRSNLNFSTSYGRWTDLKSL